MAGRVSTGCLSDVAARRVRGVVVGRLVFPRPAGIRPAADGQTGQGGSLPILRVRPERQCERVVPGVRRDRAEEPGNGETAK